MKWCHFQLVQIWGAKGLEDHQLLLSGRPFHTFWNLPLVFYQDDVLYILKSPQTTAFFLFETYYVPQWNWLISFSSRGDRGFTEDFRNIITLFLSYIFRIYYWKGNLAHAFISIHVILAAKLVAKVTKTLIDFLDISFAFILSIGPYTLNVLKILPKLYDKSSPSHLSTLSNIPLPPVFKPPWCPGVYLWTVSEAFSLSRLESSRKEFVFISIETVVGFSTRRPSAHQNPMKYGAQQGRGVVRNIVATPRGYHLVIHMVPSA